MNQKETDTISDMKIVPLEKSLYLKPQRAEFQINGKQKYWDFLKVHDSVSILIYNVTRKVVVLVRQFRPAMYLAQITNVQEGSIVKAEDHDVKKGYSLELCAGIVDRDDHIEKIAKDEVLEECGYDVPESSLRKIFSFRSVGITGQRSNLYYVEVTDEQKVSSGGGLKEEGEFIEVVELTIPELNEYINSQDLLSPPAFAAAIQWFLRNVAQS